MPLAITKAVEDAKKNLFTVPKHGSTITHEVLGRFDAARVMLRPASEGTGVIAGGGVRAVLELGGVRNVLAKSLGTTNPINMVKATVDALRAAPAGGRRRIRGKPSPRCLRCRHQARRPSRRPGAAVVAEPARAEEHPAEAPPRAAPRSLVAEQPAEEADEAPAAEAPAERAEEKPKRRSGAARRTSLRWPR